MFNKCTCTVISQETIRPILYEYLNASLKWWIGLHKTNNNWVWIRNNESYAGVP